MKITKYLLPIAVTLLFMLLNGAMGYEQNPMQNVSFYFITVIWLQQLSQNSV
jgi:hypothetical protein